MNVLSIGSDRKIFDKNSNVRKRIVEYGALVEQLHIVVFCNKALGYEKQKIGENVWVYPTNSGSRWGYVFDAIKIGKEITHAWDAWLVTAQDPFESGFAGWRVARATGARLQLQIHTDFLPPYFSKGSILNKVRVRIAKFLLPKADCVRVVSKRIADSLISAGIRLKTEPAILPIFVGISTFQSAEIKTDLHKKYPQFETIILMVSRLEREKNIPLVLAVLKNIVAKKPKTGLVIVGEGSMRAELQKYARKLHIENNVIFEGGSDDVFSFYKTADIFLHTSNYEGYGMALVEAAVAGCPIVTTDVGIAGEFFKDVKSAFICPVGDIDCLSEKTMTLIESKNVRISFAEVAKKNVLARLEKDEDAYLKKYGTLWERCGM